jgi:hypothetical protein
VRGLNEAILDAVSIQAQSILAGQLAQNASVLAKSPCGLLAFADAVGNSAVRTYDSRLPAQAGSGREWDTGTLVLA